jgi:hypothetical protein
MVALVHTATSAEDTPIFSSIFSGALCSVLNF